MGAAKKLLDKKVLKDLVPLNALSSVHLEEISRKAVIETVRSGRYVVKAGERDYQSVYLLEGKVELIDAGRDVVGTVIGGSDAARHPLAHKQPRQLSVRASGSVTVARIDSSLLDVLPTWDESSGYDVVEIGADDDGDWMTRMLQSQAFLQLPPSNIHQLLMRLQPVNARAGDVIVRQGDDGDFFYIVKSGRMAVSRKPSARSKEVLLAELGEGACFGEEALVSGARRNATVTMLTDGSLMQLSKEDFDELLRAPLVHEVSYTEARKLVDEGAEWLDVRLPGEYSNQSIAGSRNLPLSALREQAGSLSSDNRYIVCCDTGRRSASAAFILSQHGLDVYTLANGLMDVPADALTGSVEPSSVDAPVHDADILPFDNENAADASAPDALRQENDEREQALVAELEQIREQLQASEAASARQQAETDALHQRIGSLETTLDEVDAERGELAGQLDEARQLHKSTAETARALEKQLAQLESELERVREDYQQLGQRTSAVAGERDNVNRELEKALSELDELRARLDSQQGEVSEQLQVLQEQLDARSRELETETASRVEVEAALADAEKTVAAAAARESELVAQIGALEQQAGEQTVQLQENFSTERAALEQQLQALQDSVAEYQRKLSDESTEREALAARLKDIEQQLTRSQATEQSLNQALEEAAQQAEESEQRIRAELQVEQEALSAQISELESALAAQAQLADQLQEREQSLADAEQQVQVAQQQLEAQAQEMDALRLSLEGANSELEALKSQLGESGAREEQLTQRVAELEQQLVSRESEFQSDLGSAREAMARAHSELDNLKREQQRLLNRLRKAEETLERERHDRENEVHRLHKEMKEAAGGSAEGLSEELEALQAQVSEAARLRDDLEIKLGERSAQLEDAQGRAEQLDRQLALAKESAREAEQQLVEATRAANEEMEIRLNTEQGIQQGLRDALEKSEKERNGHQETITVIRQELEELREAWQQAKQAQESSADAVSRLAEVEARLDAVQTERDELLASTEVLKTELDQLRAESEVRRGLEGMFSDGEAESAESEALQQAKQNVEVAVRLRAQAEEQVESLRREVEQLKEQLVRAADIPVPPMPEGMIPSLDENDPHASNPMLQDLPEIDEVTEPEPAVLLDEEPACAPPAPPPAKTGVVKGLLAGLVIGAIAAGGFFWSQQDAGQVVTTAAESGGQRTVPSVTENRVVESEAPAGSTVPDTAAGRTEAPVPKPVPVELHAVDASESSAAEGEPETGVSSRPSVISVARGMPEIPRSEPPKAEVPADPEPGVAEDVVAESEPGPVVEPDSVVQQPAGSFRDRLADGGAGPTMVRFRADHFVMGSSQISQQFDERPQHEVQLAGFSMAAYETTFDEYDAFAGATGRTLPDDEGWGRGDRPVINVSWEDARAYADWLSTQTGARYRLPTEAEWEFVARAGAVTRYWWGDDVGQGRANCFDCGSPDSGIRPSPAGSFAASPWGVYDMAGNVREWVQDCYVPGYSRASADGSAIDVAGCAGRVVRGGAYSSPSEQLRSASRDQMDPQTRLDNLGFRVVREY